MKYSFSNKIVTNINSKSLFLQKENFKNMNFQEVILFEKEINL